MGNKKNQIKTDQIIKTNENEQRDQKMLDDKNETNKSNELLNESSVIEQKLNEIELQSTQINLQKAAKNSKDLILKLKSKRVDMDWEDIYRLHDMTPESAIIPRDKMNNKSLNNYKLNSVKSAFLEQVYQIQKNGSEKDNKQKLQNEKLEKQILKNQQKTQKKNSSTDLEIEKPNQKPKNLYSFDESSKNTIQEI